jgi:hypothetical protein
LPLDAPSASNFALQIEEIVWQGNVPYMDAVLLWCETRGLEPEVGADMVRKSSQIKLKIQVEAEDLNLMKESSKARLPV